MIKRTAAALAFVLLFFFVPAPAQAAQRLDSPPGSRVLIVGDSYTEGVGAIPETESWTYSLSPLGWKITRDGKGGSGYVNPTTYGAGVFSQRLWDHPANSYDVIIIEGSSNDTRYSDMEIATGINKAIRVAQSRYPDAQIVLLGLTNPYGNFPDDSPYWRVNAKLKSAAASYNLNFISPMEERWFVPGDGARYAQTEGSGKGHPNNAGYDVYANRFMKDINNL